MFAKQLPAFLIVLFCGLSAIAAPKDTSKCSSVSKTHIGEKKQVLLETKNCGGEVNSVADSKIAKDGNSNPTNVCGANKDPPYYTPGDCQVLYDTIWYESQRNVKGHEFVILKGQTMTMSYSTCEISFVNEGTDLDLVYCRDDWGAVIRYIATSGTCPFGGVCVSEDKNGPQWSINAVGTTPIQGN
ncbi:hypothetical protein WG66_005292 [Moniliophthora roreri]|nr:hypothetical protein WG66_005292 [Moniliophthora roreri]